MKGDKEVEVPSLDSTVRFWQWTRPMTTGQDAIQFGGKWRTANASFRADAALFLFLSMLHFCCYELD